MGSSCLTVLEPTASSLACGRTISTPPPWLRPPVLPCGSSLRRFPPILLGLMGVRAPSSHQLRKPPDHLNTSRVTGQIHFHIRIPFPPPMYGTQASYRYQSRGLLIATGTHRFAPFRFIAISIWPAQTMVPKNDEPNLPGGLRPPEGGGAPRCKR